MTDLEPYGIAAFRSRQQVMRFDSALRRAGIHSNIISTPRDVSAGCGLSVQFDLRDAAKAREIYARVNAGNLIGFYRVNPFYGGRARVSPLAGM